MVSARFSQKICNFRCDNGGEFVNQGVRDFFAEKGIGSRVEWSIRAHELIYFGHSMVYVTWFQPSVNSCIFDKPMSHFGSTRSKLDSHSRKCFMLGYCDSGYRLWRTDLKRAIVASSVKFDETKTKFEERYWDHEWQETSQAKSPKESQKGTDSGGEQKTIDEEVNSLVESETWEAVILPEGKTAIKSRWVFTLKHDKDGNFERCKARLPNDDVTKECIVNSKPYRELVGSLMYTCLTTRPDICAAVNFYSLKRVRRYLKGALDLGLRFKGISDIPLLGYADADFANQPDRKSVTGYLLEMYGDADCWATMKQQTSEFVALASATVQLLWLMQLFTDLGIELCKPITVFEDNQSCICAVGSWEQKRFKHIDKV
ncbi:hypothetical protein PR048_028478 [Dryococelus australis]|uniref:Retroviral polymerase SH3-like domain-containing protein n=1 Tax=Dryococelus australis TaxID=614101 RepID=A0ABQ9GDB5_9NEOP|nr:hypothetical protein PR048_028478 [Dryococelus australis]